MHTHILRVASLAVLLLAADLAPALAQQASLYETTETMTLRGLRNPRRIATAALFGTAELGSPICPMDPLSGLGVTRCFVNVIATDDIRIDLGSGSVSGNFFVVLNVDNQTDGPEFSIAEGTLRGTIDLLPALLGQHVATITGRWTLMGVRGGVLAGLRSRGMFTGTFRLPFGDPPMYRVGSTDVPVQPGEYSIGFPAVRLEVDFVE